MVHSRRARFDSALAAAAVSPLTRDLNVDQPWRSLGSFLFLAALLMLVMTVFIGFAVASIPVFRDQILNLGSLPDTPLRLIDESLQVILLAAFLGALAFGILLAAAVAYGRPLRDFLWPRRRFSAEQLGVGFLTMAGISVAAIPFYLATGSEWAPPLLDGQYLDQTRWIYGLAMAAGLLVAAAAEEVVFRGVLLRLTGLVTRHPLVLCLINGVLFSAIHLDPDPVAFISRMITGVVLTWAALRLGGLEFVVGTHLAHNLAIALLWQPLSEAATSDDLAWRDLGPDIVIAVVLVLMVERLARRYDNPPSGLAT